MHRFRAMTVACLLLSATAGATSVTPQAVVTSPDRRIVLVASVAGDVTYPVSLDGQEVLRKSRLGVLRDDADFTQGLDVTANYERRLAQLEKVEDVTNCHHQTPPQRLSRESPGPRAADLQPARAWTSSSRCRTTASRSAMCSRRRDAKVRKISRETSSFNFLAGTRGFLQPHRAAALGLERIESLL